MAASSKSEKLGLSLWEASDMPERLDFRGDNEALETLVGGHLNDAALHLEATEKQFVKTPYYITSYTGVGTALIRKVYSSLSSIKFALIMAQDHAPVEYDSSGNAHVYWDFCGNSGSSSSPIIVSIRGGAEISLPNTLITYSKTLEDGTVLHLNDKSTKYLVFVVQDAG